MDENHTETTGGSGWRGPGHAKTGARLSRGPTSLVFYACKAATRCCCCCCCNSTPSAPNLPSSPTRNHPPAIAPPSEPVRCVGIRALPCLVCRNWSCKPGQAGSQAGSCFIPFPASPSPPLPLPSPLPPLLPRPPPQQISHSPLRSCENHGSRLPAFRGFRFIRGM
jgi:hypothetical protein